MVLVWEATVRRCAACLPVYLHCGRAIAAREAIEDIYLDTRVSLTIALAIAVRSVEHKHRLRCPII